MLDELILQEGYGLQYHTQKYNVEERKNNYGHGKKTSIPRSNIDAGPPER